MAGTFSHGGRLGRLITRLVVPFILVAAAIVVVPTSIHGLTGGATADAAGCPKSPTTGFGNPVWVLGCKIGGQGFTSPTVGTIDGEPVVVDASLTGYVYVVNALTGTEMPGWPQRATLVGNTATAIDSSPAIAYLDGPNAEPSIVVGLGSLYVKNQNGGVMAWNYNGKVRFRFHTKHTFSQSKGDGKRYSNSVFATPAIGSLSGNGQQDIVFGSYDHYLYALNASGHVLPGFPVNRADTIWSSPALVDTTGSGKLDIIEGGDSSGWRGPNGGPKCYSGWVSDYRYLNNKPHLEWEHCLAEAVWSSPAITTFGSTPVVVVGTSWQTGAGRNVQPAEDEVFAYNAKTGAPIKGWPVKADGPTFGSPAVGPLVAGGPNDVVDSSCAACVHGPAVVSAWDEAGHKIWSVHISPHSQVLASPALAEVNGASPDNDVLIGDAAGLYVLNATNGKKIDGTQTIGINRSCNVGGTPVVAPVQGSSTGYMLFTNCGFNGPNRSANEYLRAYNVPAPTNTSPWPMFRANAQRTGVPDPSLLAKTHCAVSNKGLRVVDLTGGVTALGGAPACGGLSTRVLPAEVAGVASTPDGGGYWLTLKDGAVYAFGDAKYYGDLRLARDHTGSSDGAPGDPIVAMAATPDGKGYYLLAGDGSVYGFGDAQFKGAPGKYRAAGKPVAIAVDPATGGYWVATTSGRVYAYDAPSLGSWTSGRSGNVAGIAAAPNGKGYWLVTSSGALKAFGAVSSLGSPKGASVAGIAPSGSDGYYIVSKSGSIYAYGTAKESGLKSHVSSRSAVAAVAAG